MWKSVAQTYKQTKKKQDINLWTEWICRPIAAVLVHSVNRTRISPNQLTFLSFLVCAISCGLWLLIPAWWGAILGVVLFELSFVLDCADGQLARIRRTTSHLGHYLDFLMDEIKAIMIVATIALRLYLQNNCVTFLIVGIAGMFFLSSGIAMTTFMRRQEYGTKAPTKDGQPVTLTQNKGFFGRLVRLLEKLGRFVIHYPSYIWVCAVFDRLDIFFWAYCAANALYFAKSFLTIAVKLGRFSTAHLSATPTNRADNDKTT